MCRNRIFSMTAAAWALMPGLLLAQPYPNKPIELVVTTSAGSGGDVVSRAMAEIVRKEKFLPQQITVNNRVGGAGVVGYSYFKTKRGDPYTMMSVTGTILAMAHRPEINIGLENYTPLALFAIDPQTIMVPIRLSRHSRI
jgi:tripartite-type tricarboxylate transporter receptor subunit TctC